LKAIGIANAVKEQVNQNKENQRILAQATVEANDKIEQLEKQQAQLYAALMAKPAVTPLQDTTAATIKGKVPLEPVFFKHAAEVRDSPKSLKFFKN
jgi:hypothetical protein